MTLPTDPAHCAQCGRRPQDSTTTVRAEWEAQEGELCPLCTRGWAKVRPKPTEGRCAGCGRKTDALKEGVCSRCRKRGVSAPTLFDAPDLTWATADEITQVFTIVTPPPHTPEDEDPHA